MLGKFNGPNPIILVIEHLVIDSCRELQRCHLFNLCMRVVLVIENDLLVRSVTSEIIHREREHPHLFDLVFPEKSFQVVRVSRTSVPAGVHESGDLRLRFIRAFFQESDGVLFPESLPDA